MANPLSIVASTWSSQFYSLFSTTNLQLLLLIGSGILAISLLVLALTRWGHSRPVWKCVILSFVAHILLIGYAYGTRLIFDTPAVVIEESAPMRVNLIEELGEALTGDDSLDATEKRWDQFVNEQALPSLDQLERPAIDSEVVIEKTIDRAVEKPSTTPGSNIETIPQKFESPQFAQTPTQSDNDFQVDSKPIEVQAIEIARRGSDSPPQLNQPQFDTIPEMDRQNINNDFAPTSKSLTTPKLAFPVKDEQPFVSDLVENSAQLPAAPESLSRPDAAPKFENIKPLKPARRKNSLRVISNPRRIGDGQPLPKVYSLRNADNRSVIARQRGGSIETEKAVELALKWIADNQEDDGSWSSQKSGGGREDKIFGHNRDGAGSQADCGITALATLALLASGQSHLEGQYQNQIQRGLEFLVRSQQTNGDLSGDAKLFAKMYCHSMSLLALSEALAMTGDQRLMPAVQRGVDFTVAAQNRRDGGWRYAPGDSGDMSQFGWQVLALHSARLGKASIPNATFSRMSKFLESCSSGVGNGLASYRPKQGPSTTMTAEALMCRYFLQQSVKPTTLMEASRRIATERPTPKHVNLYYWYYGTLAMYHAGGTDWEKWNTELKRTLLTLQNQDGDNAGSWPADGVWGGYGGDVYSTSMATLSLEVYYRYLPVYQQVAEANDSENRRR